MFSLRTVQLKDRGTGGRGRWDRMQIAIVWQYVFNEGDKTKFLMTLFTGDSLLQLQLCGSIFSIIGIV